LFSTETLLVALFALAFISSVKEKHFKVLFLFPTAEVDEDMLLLSVATSAVLAPILNRLL